MQSVTDKNTRSATVNHVCHTNLEVKIVSEESIQFHIKLGKCVVFLDFSGD